MTIKFKKSALVKNLVSTNIIVPHIDRHIDKGDFEWTAEFGQKHSDDAFHPSGDCTPSLHDLYMKATRQSIPRPPSVSLRKSFIVGHFWHAYLQHIVVEIGMAEARAIEREGVKCWGSGPDDQPLPYHWAKGFGDIAPCSIPGHGDFLVDIKTMGSHHYKQTGLPEWAAAKYECQVNIYMDWFDLERTIILCVLKDSPHEMKEIIFERNQPLIDAIYGKWKIVGQCVVEGIVPPEDEPFILPIGGSCVSSE